MSPIEAAIEYDHAVPVVILPSETPAPVIIDEQQQSCRLAQASTAIDELVKAHGLATPGDLMAALGVESLPRLLAMLGFTGDLEGLADEVAALGGDSPGE